EGQHRVVTVGRERNWPVVSAVLDMTVVIKTATVIVIERRKARVKRAQVDAILPLDEVQNNVVTRAGPVMRQDRSEVEFARTGDMEVPVIVRRHVRKRFGRKNEYVP